MVDLHAAISQHTFEIAIADWKLQIPAQSLQDDLRRELPPLKQILLVCSHLRAPLITLTVIARAREPSKLQQHLKTNLITHAI